MLFEFSLPKFCKVQKTYSGDFLVNLTNANPCTVEAAKQADKHKAGELLAVISTKPQPGGKHRSASRKKQMEG